MDATQKRKKQTFIVEIIDYQKSTWKGQIHWLQEDKKISFRSVLEMLHLMNSVLLEENVDAGQSDRGCL